MEQDPRADATIFYNHSTAIPVVVSEQKRCTFMLCIGKKKKKIIQIWCTRVSLLGEEKGSKFQSHSVQWKKSTLRSTRKEYLRNNRGEKVREVDREPWCTLPDKTADNKRVRGSTTRSTLARESTMGRGKLVTRFETLSLENRPCFLWNRNLIFRRVHGDLIVSCFCINVAPDDNLHVTPAISSMVLPRNFSPLHLWLCFNDRSEKLCY